MNSILELKSYSSHIRSILVCLVLCFCFHGAEAHNALQVLLQNLSHTKSDSAIAHALHDLAFGYALIKSGSTTYDAGYAIGRPTGEAKGLELSLSYDIISKLHGGTLTIESWEGEYAEFIIQLPKA